MHVMLDTSACIEIMRGHALPEEFRGWQFSISTVVEAELWAGVFHRESTSGSQSNREREKVNLLLSSVQVFSYDSGAAKETARVLAQLASAGNKIGDFDSQIAGHCLSLGYALISADIRHFKRVQNLQVLEWQQ